MSNTLTDLQKSARTFAEFKDSSVGLSRDQYIEVFGYDPCGASNVDFVIAHRHGFHILFGDGEYYLPLLNMSFKSHNLALLQNIFWDRFAKYESDAAYTTYDQEFNDLQVRAKSLLDDLGEECSLDEVLPNNHPEHAWHISYLLREIELLDDRRPGTDSPTGELDSLDAG